MASEDELKIQLISAQYTGLRNEILKQIELQGQQIYLALIALGTALGVSVQTGNAAPALAYPILALFVALSWANNEREIRLKGAYIAVHVEQPYNPQPDPELNKPPARPDLSWEYFIHARRRRRHWYYYAYSGVFPFSELVALFVGTFLLIQESKRPLTEIVQGLLAGTFFTTNNALFIVLFGADLVSFGITFGTGLHALGRRYFDPSHPATASPPTPSKADQASSSYRQPSTPTKPQASG